MLKDWLPRDKKALNLCFRLQDESVKGSHVVWDKINSFHWQEYLVINDGVVLKGMTVKLENHDRKVEPTLKNIILLLLVLTGEGMIDHLDWILNHIYHAFIDSHFTLLKPHGICCTLIPFQMIKKPYPLYYFNFKIC